MADSKDVVVEKRKTDEAHPFNINAFMDKHMHKIKILLTWGLGAAGVVVIASSLKMMTKFTTRKSVPQEFIDKGFTLFGRVNSFSIIHSRDYVPVRKELPQDARDPGVTRTGALLLKIDHEPILRTPQWVKKTVQMLTPDHREEKGEGHLPVKVACITVYDDQATSNWLQKNIVGHTVRFKLLSRDEYYLKAVVIFKKSAFRRRVLQKTLVDAGMGFVLPYDEEMKNHIDYNHLYRYLLKREEKADKRLIWSNRIAKITKFFRRPFGP